MCVHGLLRLLRFRSHFSCTECDVVISPGRKVEKEVLKNYTTLKVYYTTLSNSSKLHACSGAVRSHSLVFALWQNLAHTYTEELGIQTHRFVVCSVVEPPDKRKVAISSRSAFA